MRRFRQLCQQHRQRIYTYARYYLGNAEDAEDATQEVLLRLWRQGQEVEEADVPRWLTRVARNVSLDQLRRRGTRREVEAPVDLATTAPGPVEELERAEFSRRLQEAIARLDETPRSLVVLRDIQGQSYDEIAQALDMPLNRVKVYLHRARQRLRQILREGEEL
jgi:RNA polymerase sigma-70 factor, ECF subfamily